VRQTTLDEFFEEVAKLPPPEATVEEKVKAAVAVFFEPPAMYKQWEEVEAEVEQCYEWLCIAKAQGAVLYIPRTNAKRVLLLITRKVRKGEYEARVVKVLE